MSLEISPQTEARLLAKARELGLSVDTLLQSLLSTTGEGAPHEPGASDLPVWDLEVSGGLHRTDIYDDAD